MAELLLDVQTRDVKKEKNYKLKRSGIVPAIIYGRGKENKAVKLQRTDILKKLHGSIASNIFIDLKIDNESSPSKTVFIKTVQRGTISREIEHIDFIEINPNEKIHITVPVVLTGTAAGIALGGLVEFSMRSLVVDCLPKDVPSEIKVDVTNLNIGESIHVSDIKLPENVKFVTNPAAAIASVIERKEEVAAAATPAEGEAPAAAAGAAPAEGEAKAGEAKAGDAKAAGKAGDAGKAAPKAEAKPKK